VIDLKGDRGWSLGSKAQVRIEMRKDFTGTSEVPDSEPQFDWEFGEEVELGEEMVLVEELEVRIRELVSEKMKRIGVDGNVQNRSPWACL
jgi:hypothetical protein